MIRENRNKDQKRIVNTTITIYDTTIANIKKRQKTKRAKLVRKKRGIKTPGIKTQSSTLELPKDSDEDIDNLLKDMKI